MHASEKVFSKFPRNYVRVTENGTWTKWRVVVTLVMAYFWKREQCSESVITGRNEVLAKVIFLHVCVILFTGGVPPNFRGGGIFEGGSSKFWGGFLQIFGGEFLQFSEGGFLQFSGGAGGGFSTRIRSTFGRYASYWNAFLFTYFSLWLWSFFKLVCDYAIHHVSPPLKYSLFNYDMVISRSPSVYMSMVVHEPLRAK